MDDSQLDPLRFDFAPEDFYKGFLTAEQKKLYRTDLDCAFYSPLRLLVESGHGQPPHVVRHDGIEPTACDDRCNWYIHRVQGYIENGEVPPKLCGHMMRAKLVLMRRHRRRSQGIIEPMQEDAAEVHNPDNIPLQKKQFGLLK